MFCLGILSFLLSGGGVSSGLKFLSSSLQNSDFEFQIFLFVKCLLYNYIFRGKENLCDILHRIADDLPVAGWYSLSLILWHFIISVLPQIRTNG